MKINRTIYPILFAGFLLPIFFCCKKEAVKVIPTVTIAAVTNITTTTATSGGEITSDGGAPVIARGVCWSAKQNPTIADSKTADSTGTGAFSSSITGLTPGTAYYIKSYAINSVGTSYSSQSTFSTLAVAPVLTTNEVTAITSTTVSCGGNVTNDGGINVRARGICWSIHQNPTIQDSITIDGVGLGNFTSSILRLIPGTVYYFRAYAINNIGTGYGNQVTATTTAILPTLSTTSLSSITYTTATGGGNISSDGGASIIARGVCWSINTNPTISDSKSTNGTGMGSFTSSITGLSPGTTYYIRAYATNSIGTAYGDNLNFKTTIPVASISLKTYPPILGIGGTYQLLEMINPETAANKKVQWESSNKLVASISENGLVTALNIGETIIKVTSEDGNHSATCTVEVQYMLKALVTDENSNPISQATVLAFDPVTKTYIYGLTNIDGRCLLTSPIKKTVTILVAHPEHKGEIILGQLNDGNVIIKMADSTYGSVLAPESNCYITGLTGRLSPILDSSNRTYLYADNISINTGTNQPVTFDLINSLKLEDAYGKVKNIWIPFADGKTFLINYRPK